MLRQSRLLGSDGSSLRRSGLPTHKQLQIRAVLAAGKDKLKRSRHKNTKRLCTAAVLAARAVGTPDTPAPSRSPSAELGGAGLAADARFDFAVEGLFHMEVFVTFSGRPCFCPATLLSCSSKHHPPVLSSPVGCLALPCAMYCLESHMRTVSLQHNMYMNGSALPESSSQRLCKGRCAWHCVIEWLA